MRYLLGMIALALLLALAFQAIFDEAGAHSWYDYACCSESDCNPTKLGDVVRRDDGWFIVQTGELIPFGDIRLKQSKDPLTHRCIYKFAMPSINKRAGDTRCLYVASPGG